MGESGRVLAAILVAALVAVPVAVLVLALVLTGAPIVLAAEAVVQREALRQRPVESLWREVGLVALRACQRMGVRQHLVGA